MATQFLIRALLFVSISWLAASHTYSQNIMKMEIIEIDVQKSFKARVQVDFYFTGEMKKGYKLAFPEPSNIQYEKFRFFAEGKRIPAKRLLPPDGRLFDFGVEMYPAVYTYEIPEFSKGQKENPIHHRVEYSFKLPYYFETGSKGEDSNQRYIEYIVKTGSLWDDSIERIYAIVNFEDNSCKSSFALATSLKGACIDESTWYFEGTNIEPFQNIELVIPIP